MLDNDSQSAALFSAIFTVLDEAERTFTNAGIGEASVDAELLLGHVLGVSRGRVQALRVLEESLDAETATRYRDLVSRRAAREPLQHLTGTAPFRSLELEVGPGVFVPRPETEQVAQLAIDALQFVPAAEPIAVDLGTGSGALALALALEVPHAQVYAVEKSNDAFEWATRNVTRYSAGNVHLVLDDLARALPDLTGRVDVVVSNPPYIPDEAIPRDAEVRLYDPKQALYGGPDGLDVVRQISVVAHRLLRVGGVLILEHGEYQGAQVRQILANDGWRQPRTFPDLTTRDRMTSAIRSADARGEESFLRQDPTIIEPS